MADKGTNVLWCRDFCLTIILTENRLLLEFELFSRQVKHVKGLILYSFSDRATQSTIDFLILIPLKHMLIVITITINKTHNIHALIYAASNYDFVNIVMAMKHFHDLLMNYSWY